MISYSVIKIIIFKQTALQDVLTTIFVKVVHVERLDMRIKSLPIKLLFIISAASDKCNVIETKENFCHESALKYKFLFESQITSERV